jgi:hypothetical protein
MTQVVADFSPTFFFNSVSNKNDILVRGGLFHPKIEFLSFLIVYYKHGCASFYLIISNNRISFSLSLVILDFILCIVGYVELLKLGSIPLSRAETKVDMINFFLGRQFLFDNYNIVLNANVIFYLIHRSSITLADNFYLTIINSLECQLYFPFDVHRLYNHGRQSHWKTTLNPTKNGYGRSIPLNFVLCSQRTLGGREH